MGLEDIKKHINTIMRQDEIVKFICERETSDPSLVKSILDSLQVERQQGIS